MTPGRLDRLPVTQIMQKPVPAIPAATPMALALDMMVRLGVRHLAAIDPHGRCLGVLSDRSIAGAWAAGGTALDDRTVRSSLPTRPAVIGSNAVVGQVARLMTATGATAVAVTDPQGLPVGIITGADLVALLSRDPDQQVRR